MIIDVALSGEKFDARLPTLVCGVGLLRGEYLLRRIKRHFGDAWCRKYVRSYLKFVLDSFRGKPVWYRFCDAPSNELNMLRGVDAYVIEEFPTVGIRGMRRAMHLPETFEIEFRIVAELARDYENLHVVFPYVSELKEVAFGLEVAVKVGFVNRIATMLEIPAAFFHAGEFRNLGIRDFIIGMNDLSSLALGAGRGAGFDRHDHPAVIDWLTKLRATLPDSTLSIAGYHRPEFSQVVDRLKFDRIVIHYSSLSQVFGEAVRNFRELDFMPNYKRSDNRKRLRQWSQDLLQCSYRENGIGMQGTGTIISKARPQSYMGRSSNQINVGESVERGMSRRKD